MISASREGGATPCPRVARAARHLSCMKREAPSRWAMRAVLTASLATSFASEVAAATPVVAPAPAASATPAATDGPTPAEVDTKEVARRAAREGLELMHQERWAEAQALLARAYKLVAAPTIAVLEGRSLEQLGRLVEASRCYEAAAAGAAPDAPPAFRDAAADAKARLEALVPKIPKLSVVLDRAGGEGEPVVLLDGRVMDPREWSAPFPVDPGEHAVGVRVGTEVLVEDHVLVKTGESKQVVLRLGGARASGPEAAPAASAEGEPRRSPARTWGWVSLGIGSAGMATGVVAGVVMLNAKSSLDAVCTPVCPESASEDLSRFRGARTVSTVGYGVGLVGLGVGAALLLFAPSTRERPVQTALAPWVSPAGVGVEHRF
jgi:hypothetical protein